jgi:hypothetical protein
MAYTPHQNQVNESEMSGLFQQRRTLLLITLFVLFTAAIAVRLIFLQQSYMVSERQFRSAIISRAFTLKTSDAVPEWRKNVAATSQENMGVLEPPILELLTSLTHRIIGRDHLTIARLFSTLFWMVGGFFLYRLVKKIASTDAAVYALAYYLFAPLGIRVSITFLPDPLMIMMFIISLFAMVWYFEQPSKSRLIVAAVIAGLAILAKPFVLFAVVSGFVALAIYEHTNSKRIKISEYFIFLAICLAVSALFYIYGIVFSGNLSSNFQAGFFPYLFFEPSYWRNWLQTAIAAVGFAPLVIGLAGIAILPSAMSRALIIGLWIGYILFGLAYTFPIGFAGYYHLQLLVILAITIGPVVALFAEHLRRQSYRWYWWIPVAGAVLLIAFFNFRDLRRDLNSAKRPESESIAQEIGELVEHGSKNVYVATFYGRPLEYYGQLSGTYWQNRIADIDWVQDGLDGRIELSGANWVERAVSWIFRRVENQEISIEERLAALDFVPEYFIVSDLQVFERRHSDLKEHLGNHCSLISDSDEYLVYGDCP